ncbi:DUF885 domain-containing protein [Psychroflexus sediminis]|uniref:Uncharacterized conserved protein, DUF885 familyt n=1 Tax=Psychroflexus sediminis TaxID=470826 RepID=A0A1G7VZ86_9FLAO|nr:DUF885 domain-containing protein [Psychroflexus sediminis]SDG64971.1 Uncharacterized conserved protein, DUF885 familyt [Psychroflexus sediminis]
MTKKKRTWKFWTGSTLLVLFILGGLWLTNLIWFKPFSITHFYEKVFVELVLDSPELTTTLGVPIIYDWSKDELNDISDAKQWENFNKAKEDYETLLSYNYENQSPENQLNTDILGYYMKMNTVEAEPFFYHNYPVNQMYGIQNGLPSMMESYHKLNDVIDIEAYISRLSKFDTKFSQLIEGLKIREAKGIITPKFINTILISEMKGFVGTKTDSLGQSHTKPNAVTSNILYTNFETKVDALKEISEEEKTIYKKEVAEAMETSVFPAYKNLISYFEHLNLKATNTAGVWKLPNGDAYYRHMLKLNTTTDYTPEQVHSLGLSEVDRIKSEMYAILEAENYRDSTKTIGQIIQQLNTEERFLYPDSDAGREKILADYKRMIDHISQNMSEAFNIRPKAGLEVKRVPEFKEAGMPLGYYEGPAMDGSRGGVFYANLRDTKEHVTYFMKTLAYHEGVPGHHFQLAIQNELQGIPTFRTVIPFTAYSEGWALYAERLAWELGFYENDPFGNLGRLQSEMFRAVRLVVDTGMHYKKWTREEAIDYMIQNTGMPTSDVITEIERYVVAPGQACAYKVGMLEILELREKAKQELGSQFDLREFHNAVLQNGAIPLDVLEKVINDYIQMTLENQTV